MAQRRWSIEYRTTEVNGIDQGAWWLTDGKESFRMVARFVGEMLAGYLNGPTERTS